MTVYLINILPKNTNYYFLKFHLEDKYIAEHMISKKHFDDVKKVIDFLIEDFQDDISKL